MKNTNSSFLIQSGFLLGSLLLLGSVVVWADGSAPIQSTNFSSLFNQYRVGQPNPVPWAGSFFPYGYDGTGMGVNTLGQMTGKPATESTPSPLMEYQKVFSTKGAQEWEVANHTCSTIKDPEEQKGCKGWWGHCNGWSAAAIKEQEPRKPASVHGGTLSVAAQKGILTEYWLESTSFFEGNTDKSKKTGDWIQKVKDPDYQAFWDVSPRQFFLLVTNYLGVQKTGVVIDRFTGEQVWNQPLVGYRVLPIDTSSMTQIQEQGKVIYRYLFALKIFWANDGVHPGHVSRQFQIKDISDDPAIEDLMPDYDGRLLKFYLSFDAPLRVSSGGMAVQGNPRMIGDGTWFEQQSLLDNPVGAANWEEYNHGHPDFVWVPLNGFDTGNGYRNPLLQGHHVEELSRVLAGTASTPTPTHPPTPTPAPQPPPTPAPPEGDLSSEFSIIVRKTEGFNDLSDSAISAELEKAFGRAGLQATISDVTTFSLGIQLRVVLSRKVTEASLTNSLTGAGLIVVRLEGL